MARRLRLVTYNVHSCFGTDRRLDPGRIAEVIAEHAAILEAVAANDPAAAIKALDDHLDDLQISIADIRRDYPRYFTAPGDPV